MGFEITYFFHPRKEDGGYDTSIKEEKTAKVGKPFDDTPMEKLAASIMGQLARRDIWVVDVKVDELVRKEVSFKECKDGKGIVLKNRRFSFNGSSELECEAVEELPASNVPMVYPHEQKALQAAEQPQDLDALYHPNRAVPVKRTMTTSKAPVNQKKILYYVNFEPEMYTNEAKRMNLKFTPDKRYPVHQIVPHPMGRLDQQKLILTDDMGRAVEVEDKFFVTVGSGLLADRELGFSSQPKSRVKLAFEDQMVDVHPDEPRRKVNSDIPLDDGSIPDHYMQMPEIRRQ